MEKTMEALRHTQARCSEQEKINKKLTEQTHAYTKEIVKLKRELQGSKAKVCKSSVVQLMLNLKLIGCRAAIVLQPTMI